MTSRRHTSSNTSAGQTNRIWTEIELLLRLLRESALQNSDEKERADSQRQLVDIGVRVCRTLVTILRTPGVGDELRCFARKVSEWPTLYSAWPSDREEMLRLLPLSTVGSEQEIRFGKWDLATTPNRWAFAYVQLVQRCRMAWNRHPELEPAKAYLLESHRVEVVFDDDLLDAVRLPRLTKNPAVSKKWKLALRRHVLRHYPEYGLCQHRDWVAEGRNAGRTSERLDRNPKDFQAWIFGRINRSLQSMAAES
jgi:hypothetical protein